MTRETGGDWVDFGGADQAASTQQQQDETPLSPQEKAAVAALFRGSPHLQALLDANKEMQEEVERRKSTMSPHSMDSHMESLQDSHMIASPSVFQKKRDSSERTNTMSSRTSTTRSGSQSRRSGSRATIPESDDVAASDTKKESRSSSSRRRGRSRDEKKDRYREKRKESSSNPKTRHRSRSKHATQERTASSSRRTSTHRSKSNARPRDDPERSRRKSRTSKSREASMDRAVEDPERPSSSRSQTLEDPSKKKSSSSREKSSSRKHRSRDRRRSSSRPKGEDSADVDEKNTYKPLIEQNEKGKRLQVPASPTQMGIEGSKRSNRKIKYMPKSSKPQKSSSDFERKITRRESDPIHSSKQQIPRSPLRRRPSRTKSSPLVDMQKSATRLSDISAALYEEESTEQSKDGVSSASSSHGFGVIQNEESANLAVYEMRQRFKREFPNDPLPSDTILRQLYKTEKIALWDLRERYYAEHPGKKLPSDKEIALYFDHKGMKTLSNGTKTPSNAEELATPQTAQTPLPKVPTISRSQLMRQQSAMSFATEATWEGFGKKDSSSNPSTRDMLDFLKTRMQPHNEGNEDDDEEEIEMTDDGILMGFPTTKKGATSNKTFSHLNRSLGSIDFFAEENDDDDDFRRLDRKLSLERPRLPKNFELASKSEHTSRNAFGSSFIDSARMERTVSSDEVKNEHSKRSSRSKTERGQRSIEFGSSFDDPFGSTAPERATSMTSQTERGPRSLFQGSNSFDAFDTKPSKVTGGSDPFFVDAQIPAETVEANLEGSFSAMDMVEGDAVDRFHESFSSLGSGKKKSKDSGHSKNIDGSGNLGSSIHLLEFDEEDLGESKAKGRKPRQDSSSRPNSRHSSFDSSQGWESFGEDKPALNSDLNQSERDGLPTLAGSKKDATKRIMDKSDRRRAASKDRVRTKSRQKADEQAKKAAFRSGNVMAASGWGSEVPSAILAGATGGGSESEEEEVGFEVGGKTENVSPLTVATKKPLPTTRMRRRFGGPGVYP